MPTPNLAIEPLASAQAQKHLTVNEALARIDAVTQLAALDRDLAEPPGTPDDGDRYLVAPAASGDWAGHDGEIASWDEAAQTWIFLVPREGWRLWLSDEALFLIRQGGAWVEIGATALNPVEGALLGINTSADATNRLAVKSEAMLLSHDDVTPGSGDVRLAVNRAAPANAASILFQTAYAGQAEIGLTAPESFALRVAPDGVTFDDALRVDTATGVAAFPHGLTLGTGVTVEQVAEGFIATERARREAVEGNLALTASVVMDIANVAGDNTVIASADDENLLTIDGTYVATLARGEVFSGAYPAGTLIETTRGHAGATSTQGGPMPLGLAGMSGRRFFFFAFRSSEGTGFVTAAAGAVPARVELRNGAGIRSRTAPSRSRPTAPSR